MRKQSTPGSPDGETTSNTKHGLTIPAATPAASFVCFSATERPLLVTATLRISPSTTKRALSLTTSLRITAPFVGRLLERAVLVRPVGLILVPGVESRSLAAVSMGTVLVIPRLVGIMLMSIPPCLFAHLFGPFWSSARTLPLRRATLLINVVRPPIPIVEALAPALGQRRRRFGLVALRVLGRVVNLLRGRVVGVRVAVAEAVARRVARAVVRVRAAVFLLAVLGAAGVAGGRGAVVAGAVVFGVGVAVVVGTWPRGLVRGVCLVNGGAWAVLALFELCVRGNVEPGELVREVADVEEGHVAVRSVAGRELKMEKMLCLRTLPTEKDAPR